MGSAEVLTTVVLRGAPAVEVLSPPPPPMLLLRRGPPPRVFDCGGGVGFATGLTLVAGDCCCDNGWASGLTLGANDRGCAVLGGGGVELSPAGSC